MANFKYLDESLSIEDRINELMALLTLEEKFLLLSGHHIWWTHAISRLKIPKLGTSDGPRGISFHSSYKKNTQFPAPKTIAATWNRECPAWFGEAVAEEIRARKKHVLLAPGINIDRTPLNGRTFEYLSEDPFFIKEMTVPLVKAVQKHRIAACVKHYAANNQETNRHFVSAEMDERTLREIYTKAFEFIVKESDPWSFMSCYNRVNGVFGSENEYLLRDLLINKFGFNGFVMSDWFATKHIKDPSKAIKAGLSLEMPNKIIYTKKKLRTALFENEINESEIDDVLKRMLRIMFLTGVFDKNLPSGSLNTKEHQEVAKKIAEEGITLLKNENSILPLEQEKIKTIAVLGYNANRKFGKILYGGSSAVLPPFEITPLMGLKRKLGSKVKFVKEPKNADYAIIITGLNHNVGMDSEAGDRTQLELPLDQEKLILDTVAENPRTIVVLLNGSPIAMENWINKVPAIIEGWYPGMLGGDVLADVIFGDLNPSGKLPITFPKSLKDCPAHQSTRTFPGYGQIFKENLITDVFKKVDLDKVLDECKVYYDEGIFVGYRWFEKNNIDPLFPFGFGLSYTTFNYVSCELSSALVKKHETIMVKVAIKNSGNRDGKEVIQVYYTENTPTVERPVKELCGFEKIMIKAGETTMVEIPIKVSDFAFFDVQSKDWKVNSGEYTLHIGASSRDIKFSKQIRVE